MNIAEKRIAVKRILARKKLDAKAPVIQEQHPEIGILDRFAIKNLDMSPEQTEKYLKGQYPEMQTKVHNDQVVAKFKNENEWKVIDPSGFDIQDVTDLMGMVPEGAAQVAGGSLGALGGLSVGGPVGAVPGLMAGAGAAGGATNIVKQKLREYLGAQEELDLPEAGTAAAASGLLAPLFGGASPAVVKKIVSPAIKKIVGRGLVGTGYDVATRKAAPKIASFLSGGQISGDEFKYAVSNPKILERIAEDPTRPGEALKNFLKKRIKYAKSTLKPEFESMSKSDAIVDISGAMAQLRNVVLDLKKAADANPGIKAFQTKFMEAAKLYDEVALEGTGAARQEIGKTTVATANKLKNLLGELADASQAPKLATGSKKGAIYSAAVDAKTKIQKTLDKFSGSMNKEYKKLSDADRNIKQLFDAKTTIGETTKSAGVLKRVGKKGHEEFTKKFKDLAGPLKVKSSKGTLDFPGVDVESMSLAQRAYHSLYKPSFQPNFQSRTFGNLGAKMLLGGMAGAPWGPGGMAAGAGLGMIGTSPGMLKKYLTTGKGLESIVSGAAKYTGAKPGLRGLITSELGE